MRIVLVNWARIWDGASSGGGVNGYVQALALALAARGHDVVSLCGGTLYRPRAYGAEPGPCRIVRHPDWLGIRVFEVANSPVLAPSIAQFRNPEPEARSPELEARVAEFFAALDADAVHFHNIEGFSAGCISAARASGAAVFYSIHNYHTICPQVYLMKGHRAPCFDSRGGLDCAGCIDAEDPAAEARRRAAASVAASATTEPARHDRQRLRLLRRHAPATPAPPAPPADPQPEHPWREVTAAELDRPMPAAGPDARGKTVFLRGESQPRRWPSPLDGEWAVVPNDPAPEPAHDGPPSPYGERRAAMIAALNTCDAVLAVSEFVRAKFVAMGVRDAVVRTAHIGTRACATAERHAELVFEPPPPDPAAPRPVRLVFMGINHWYKGLPMLADTLELLTPDYLRRLHLSVHAQGIESIEWRFRRLEPRLGGLRMGGAFEPHDIPWICGGHDAGLVPSVWWDNAPQTIFEFFACGLPVVGANLGGIPDFVRQGENGLLFRGNDRFDLAATLVSLVRDPEILPRLRAGVRPPKRIEDHAAELEALYAAAGRRGGGGPMAAPSATPAHAGND